ncbi:glucosaminidase domain-containing protein [Paenibacillus turpanensis]|uniref:glucosaminidase domain-containing protein n=1 Tax=Paenibacillus turpanensis TaxID=2689078 RepID=UPI00140E6048|nr:glucosaminidase domain-containing protein [Paenibacillus turpanensis]
MQELVLSGEEILRLKQYIEHKHQNSEPRRKALILADAVHRTVESRLPGFPDTVKKQIRHRLLENHKSVMAIRVDDVFRECLTLNLEQEELLTPFIAWTCSKFPSSLHEEEVRRVIMNEFHGIAAEGTQAQLDGIGALEQALAEALPKLARTENEPQEAAHPLKQTLLGSLTSYRPGMYIMGAALLLLLALLLMPPSAHQSTIPESVAVKTADPAIYAAEKSDALGGISNHIRYTAVDKSKLQLYLANKKSALAEEPYISAIIQAAEKHDLHPLLLFAITGQEQGFVPSGHKQAKQIANNPFNVFGSWERYSTTIEDSAHIAAKLIVKLSKDRPAGSDPIQWINHTYAEDPNWWKGVTWLFEDMKREVQHQPQGSISALP